MKTASQDYRSAGGFMFLAALLHLPVLALGFASYALVAGLVIVIWLALGAGLMRGYRGVAYLAFLAALIGAVAAFGAALGNVGLLGALLWGILGVDVLAAGVLFGILWRARTPAEGDYDA